MDFERTLVAERLEADVALDALLARRRIDVRNAQIVRQEIAAQLLRGRFLLWQTR